jgi:hypothetical protein
MEGGVSMGNEGQENEQESGCMRAHVRACGCKVAQERAGLEDTKRGTTTGLLRREPGWKIRRGGPPRVCSGESQEEGECKEGNCLRFAQESAKRRVLYTCPLMTARVARALNQRRALGTGREEDRLQKKVPSRKGEADLGTGVRRGEMERGRRKRWLVSGRDDRSWWTTGHTGRW